MAPVKAIPKITNATGKTIAALFLLPKCDMGCTFCASDLGFDRMSFDQACDLIQGLHASGYSNVVLGGGEPALWRDGDKSLADIARFAKDLGLEVQVNTNGIRLPKDFANIEQVDRFIFPMDGATAAGHDSLRVILGATPAGHFDLVQRRVAECIQAGQQITIGTVLNATNHTEVPALISWMRERLAEGANIHAWHLYRFQAVGRGGVSTADTLSLSQAQFRAACDEAKAADLPFPTWRREDMFHSSTVEFFWYEKGELLNGSDTWAQPTEAPQATGT
jgi:MoaA/NifB/PqqE/SkfB family radical SAM enzyme